MLLVSHLGTSRVITVMRSEVVGEGADLGGKVGTLIWGMFEFEMPIRYPVGEVMDILMCELGV